jgi:hypothetical protein
MEYQVDWETDVIYPQDLVALVSLSAGEQALLSSLQPTAQAAAMRLGDTLSERLAAHPCCDAGMLQNSQQMTGDIQKWFVELYSPDHTASLHPGPWFSSWTVSPVSYLLAFMDVIIDAGRLVASQSPDFEQARSAFNKALARDLALYSHLYEERQYQFDSTMMLLD